MPEENEVATILNAAADLLTHKGAWTKGAFARDRSGQTTNSTNSNACSWCVVGAIGNVTVNATPGQHWQAIKALTHFLQEYLGDILPTEWNDDQRSAKPVIAALRGAAEANEA